MYSNYCFSTTNTRGKAIRKPKLAFQFCQHAMLHAYKTVEIIINHYRYIILQCINYLLHTRTRSFSFDDCYLHMFYLYSNQKKVYFSNNYIFQMISEKKDGYQHHEIQ